MLPSSCTEAAFVHQAYVVSDLDSLQGELSWHYYVPFLRAMAHTQKDIDWELDHKNSGKLLLPFYGDTSAKIGRLARKLQFWPVFKPAVKIKQHCVMLKTHWDCGCLVFMPFHVLVRAFTLAKQGEWWLTGWRSVATYVCLNQPEKSWLAEHGLIESLLNRLEPRYMNRDTGLFFSSSWKPLL